MRIKSLEHVEISKIVECFNVSFADYFVKMPSSVDFWEERWKAARVDYSLSFGMFDGYDLVGFIINGVDYKNGFLTAFNTGTGVIPAYRGQKIVKQIYDFAIPVLLVKGIQSCSLEVIVGNDKAIKAYKSVGFKISRTLKCYSGELQIGDSDNLMIEKKPIENVQWGKLPNQKYYSWDFQKNAIEILNKDYQYFQVLENQQLLGYFILNPESGTLAQVEIENSDTKEAWLKMFSAIKKVTTYLKINNVDDRLIFKNEAIKEAGLKNTIDQFEMDYIIKSEN